MKITYAKIRGYKRFKNSKIQTIELNFTTGVTIVAGSNSSGKLQPNRTPIRTDTGWRKLGDIHVGDKVMTRDGSFVPVLGVFPQGIKPIYRVTFEDGRYTDCGPEHLWTVHRKFWKRDRYTVFETEYLRQEMQSNQEVFYVPLVQPERNPDIPLPIPPYVLGVLLGDGCLRENGVTVTTDGWVIEKCNRLLPPDIKFSISTGDSRYGQHAYTRVGHLSKKSDSAKALIKYLSDNALTVKSYYKYIPEEYFQGSYQQRLELLQGLMDTDGCLNKAGMSPNFPHPINCSPEFSTSSERLIKDVQRLVWALGGKFSYSSRIPHFTYKGEYRAGAPSYRGVVRLRNLADCFTLPRKLANLTGAATHRSDILKLRITSITPLPTKEECTCIYVDHPEHLYVVENYIVTHNTSLLYALNPLPQQRSEYNPGGFKELHITHDNKLYILISDFSNKVSPHSFKVDGIELNTSHTTEVQTELVEKHFGLTPIIRSLIYSKIQLCSLSKANRKNLFLQINPMKLGLILDMHKKVQGRIRDCKANLSLLYRRKAETEGKLIEKDLLRQHTETKKILNEQMLTLDKLIYALEQHVLGIKDKYTDDLTYAEAVTARGEPLIPKNEITQHCKKVKLTLADYTDVPRGDALEAAKTEIGFKVKTVWDNRRSLEQQIAAISKEINEYQKHLETATDRPVSKIEKEITELEKELKRFKKLPEYPIPPDQIDSYYDLSERINRLLFTFRDSGVKMIDPQELERKLQEKETTRYQLATVSKQYNYLENCSLKEDEEIQEFKEQASIPPECQLTACGLRLVYSNRATVLEEKHKETLKALEPVYKQMSELQVKQIKLIEELKPFEEHQLLSTWKQLQSLLSSGYLHYVDFGKDLLTKVNTQPLLIGKAITEYIEQSKQAAEANRLKKKKDELTTEIKVLTESSGASTEFLQTKLKEKEHEVQKQLSKLKDMEAESESLSRLQAKYTDYSNLVEKLTTLKEKYDKGERAILVSKALSYWKALGKAIVTVKSEIGAKLRQLETIVHDQNLLHNVYDNEIMKYITTIEKDKIIYEKMEMALSPSTGMPHKSMVKYLNALIKNVNIFISKIWSFNLRILPVNPEDPLDYGFRVEQGSEVTDDIAHLSDGQTEVMNMAWVLTILLQMRMLNKVPFYSDELGRCMDVTHRNRLLVFLGQLMESKQIEQLFMVNHFALNNDCFGESEIICLNQENIPDLPANTNQHVTIS